jgi:hypothetical protein
MLAFDPKKRVSVDNALRHPYLSAFHSEERYQAACSNGPMKADIESICEDQDHILSSVRKHLWVLTHTSVCLMESNGVLILIVVGGWRNHVLQSQRF